jgi:hypothetical protein
VLVGGCVEGPAQADPPSSPAIGAAYIVGAGATGAWSGKTDQIAAWTSGGWRFIRPFEGLQLLDRSTQTISAYRSGSWELGIVRATALKIGGLQVVGARQGTIAAPSGGTVVDAQARASIASILSALQAHGLVG